MDQTLHLRSHGVVSGLCIFVHVHLHSTAEAERSMRGSMTCGPGELPESNKWKAIAADRRSPTLKM